MDQHLDPRAASDAAWNAQRPKPNGSAEHQSQSNGNDADEIFSFTIASSLAGREPPERPWLVRDWLPCRQVTLLSGDGGVGKSLLAMQLMMSLASGEPWLDIPITPCRVFGVFAEDDEDELHRRLNAIAKAQSIDLAQLDWMAWRCSVTDPCELVESDSAGNLKPTAYYQRLVKSVREFGARLLVLDGHESLRRRNPGGRPAALAEVRQLARQHTALAVQKLAYIVEYGHSEMAQIAAANALLDRGWGRPTQPVSGDDEMPPVGIGWGVLNEAERDRLVAVLIEGLRQ